MAVANVQTTQTTEPTDDVATDEPVTDGPVTDEVLVEEISIDGMCGVY